MPWVEMFSLKFGIIVVLVVPTGLGFTRSSVAAADPILLNNFQDISDVGPLFVIDKLKVTRIEPATVVV
jgi:hypothetical protein